MTGPASRGACAAAAVLAILAVRQTPAADGSLEARVVSVMATPGYAWDVDAWGSNVCVAGGVGGLAVYTASAATNPVPAGSYPAAYPDETRALACADGRVWLAQWGRLGCPWRSRIDVISLVNPAAPACVASAPIEGALAWSVACEGSRAAFGLFANADVKIGIGASSSVRLYEMASPPALRDVWASGALAFGRGVAWQDGRVYAADLNAGIAGWPESSPTGSPPVLSYAWPDSTNGGRMVYDVAVRAGVLFAACGLDGVVSLDVSDLAAPHPLGSLDTPGEARGLSLYSNLAAVADGGSGVVLLDVRNPRAPVSLLSVDTPGVAEAVCLSSNVLYVADGPAGLVTIALTPSVRKSPSEEALLFEISSSGDAPDAREIAAPRPRAGLQRRETRHQPPTGQARSSAASSARYAP